MDLASRKEHLLGSVIEVKVPSSHEALLAPCFGELARIERTYSRFRDDSALSRLNAALGRWHEVPGEFFSLIARAVALNEETGGNFDITLKASLDRLGYDKAYSFVPKPRPRKGVVDAALERLRAPILLDAKRSRVLLRKEIDFGGFGKGFALDAVARVLEDGGCPRHYIDAGGDILAKGGGEPWTILLEHPDAPERAIGKVLLDGEAIAGSAPNRRRWRGQHHLLNARTGMPANGAKCIFAVAKTGLEADAYATAIFTAGFSEGIALSKRLPVEILFVSSEDRMYVSEGFKAELFS